MVRGFAQGLQSLQLNLAAKVALRIDHYAEKLSGMDRAVFQVASD